MRAAPVLVVVSALLVACGDGGARSKVSSSSTGSASSASSASAMPSAAEVPSAEDTSRARAWPGPKQQASFPAEGIRKVVLRAVLAKDATVKASSDGKINVSGTPVLRGIEGRPSDGAFNDAGFVSKGFDDALLVTTKGEFFYIHFGTVMNDLVIEVPDGIEVVREPMVNNGDTKPDLRPPGSPPRPEGR